MTDQELKDLVASLAVKSDRLDAAQAARDASWAKTEAVLAARDAIQTAQNAALLEAQAARDASWAKLEAQFARTDAKMAKSDAQFDTMKKMLDGVSKNQGSVAEEYFYKSLSKLPSLGGIRFDRVTPHFVAGRKGKQQEYDVVLVNGNSVAVVEVKYKAHVNDLPQVHAQVARFKEDCPEFKTYAIYGGIAGLSMPDEVAKAALAQGLFVLSREGRSLTVQAQGMRAL